MKLLFELSLLSSPPERYIFLPLLMSELYQKNIPLCEFPVWSNRPVRILWVAWGFHFDWYITDHIQ